MINLRSVDLNLMPVFEAVYEERSLSRAATRLAMTQPAVSHALSRLRATFREELFARHSRGMTPTPAADAIYAKLTGAMQQVREAVGETRGFDPRTSRRQFGIAIPHALGSILALKLLESFATRVPNGQLSFDTRSRPADLERRLANGGIDIAIDWLPARHEALVEDPLFNDSLVAVARDGHPALGKAARARDILDKWEFVRLRPRLEGDRHSIEGIQSWLQRNPKVRLEVSEFLEVLVVASQSDLLGLVPASLAGSARAMLGVRVVPGLTGTSVPVRMIWPANRRHDDAHKFLRQQVMAATRVALGGRMARGLLAPDQAASRPG